MSDQVKKTQDLPNAKPDIEVKFDAFRMGIGDDDISMEFGVKDGDSYRSVSRYIFDRDMFYSLVVNCFSILNKMQETGKGYDDINVNVTLQHEEKGEQ